MSSLLSSRDCLSNPLVLVVWYLDALKCQKSTSYVTWSFASHAKNGDWYLFTRSNYVHISCIYSSSAVGTTKIYTRRARPCVDHRKIWSRPFKEMWKGLIMSASGPTTTTHGCIFWSKPPKKNLLFSFDKQSRKEGGVHARCKRPTLASGRWWGTKKESSGP